MERFLHGCLQLQGQLSLPELICRNAFSDENTLTVKGTEDFAFGNLSMSNYRSNRVLTFAVLPNGAYPINYSVLRLAQIWKSTYIIPFTK